MKKVINSGESVILIYLVGNGERLLEKHWNVEANKGSAKKLCNRMKIVQL